MKLDGSIHLAADSLRVWNAIVDPVSLGSCVPGVGSIEQVDDTTFRGTITAAVGPIEGQFAFTSVLAEAVFPDRLDVAVSGTDSVTKSLVRMNVRASVTAIDGETDLRYTSTIVVEGRLAILGEMVLRAAAGVIVGQVTRCLRRQLEAGPAETTDDVPTVAVIPHGAGLGGTESTALEQ